MSSDRVQMLEMELGHERTRALYYEQMARVQSEVLWELILTLNLPPERDPEPPVLFGSWSAKRVLAAVRDAVQGPGEAEAVPGGLAPADKAGEPGEVPDDAGQGQRAEGSPAGGDLGPEAAHTAHVGYLAEECPECERIQDTWRDYVANPAARRFELLSVQHVRGEHKQEVASCPECTHPNRSRGAYVSEVSADHALGRHAVPHSGCLFCTTIGGAAPV